MKRFICFLMLGFAFTALQAATVSGGPNCADPAYASMPECVVMNSDIVESSDSGNESSCAEDHKWSERDQYCVLK